MTYIECYKWGIEKLKSSKIDDADFDSRQLFQFVFGFDRMKLILRGEDKAPSDELEKFRQLILKRSTGYPLQYILGEWDFYNLSFKVGEGVLVPRPETELLVDTVLEKLGEYPDDYTPRVLDLCAGSGCVGITIAKNAKNVSVTEIEKSSKALKYLNENVSFNDADNVNVVEGDILDGFENFNLEKPDIIVSNPPYIRTGEIPYLQSEVLVEPQMALDGGADGLEFYNVIAEKWIPNIKHGGLICVECGEDQAEQIKKIFLQFSENVFTKLDFSGIMRVVCAKIL